MEHDLEADRATRSTDSSAEAAGMERAAKWVDDRADAYDRDHGTTDPDTGTRWWPGDGEDYMFELDEIATGIRAEAAKLTTAPHTKCPRCDNGLLADDDGYGGIQPSECSACDGTGRVAASTAPHTADETRVDGGAT